MKDCSECLDVANLSGVVPEDKLAYGDWMRTHIHAQQPKVVMGSLSRSTGRTRSSEPPVHTPTASITEETSAKTISTGTEKCRRKGHGAFSSWGFGANW